MTTIARTAVATWAAWLACTAASAGESAERPCAPIAAPLSAVRCTGECASRFAAFASTWLFEVDRVIDDLEEQAAVESDEHSSAGEAFLHRASHVRELREAFVTTDLGTGWRALPSHIRDMVGQVAEASASVQARTLDRLEVWEATFVAPRHTAAR